MQTIAEAESKPIEAESVNEKTLAKIVKVIEDNIADPDLNVNLLCEKSGIPNKQLYRLIKKYMGIGPLDYIRQSETPESCGPVEPASFHRSRDQLHGRIQDPVIFCQMFPESVWNEAESISK